VLTDFVCEGVVGRVALFPVELLGHQAQVSLLEEFGGRHPSISEVASIPEADLMKLAGFGPSTIRKVRSIIQGGIASSSTVASLSDEELLSEQDRLLAKRDELRNEFKQQDKELQQQLRTIRLELRVRGLLSK
jgi:hypothetical protein